MDGWVTIKGMHNEHTEWLRAITKGDSLRRVSELAGISHVTLSRQLRAGTLTTDTVIHVANAYEESPVAGLVELGFISERWLEEMGVASSLMLASDEQLTDELLRRLRLLPDEPITDVADMRKAQRDGSVVEFDSRVPHAADSSPDERGVDD